MNPKKLHIAIICPVDFVGGAELFVIDIANELAAKHSEEVEITVISSKKSHFISRLHPSVHSKTMTFPAVTLIR